MAHRKDNQHVPDNICVCHNDVHRHLGFLIHDYQMEGHMYYVRRCHVQMHDDLLHRRVTTYRMRNEVFHRDPHVQVTKDGEDLLKQTGIKLLLFFIQTKFLN